MSTRVEVLPWTRDTHGYSLTDTHTVGTATNSNSETKSALVRTQKVDGWRPPTDYDRYIESGVIDRGFGKAITTCKWRPSNGGYTNTVTHVGAMPSDQTFRTNIPDFPTYLENQAIVKARLKLKDAKVDLGTAFGEREQTGRLVLTTCKRLAGAIRSVRELDFLNAARSLGMPTRSIRGRKKPFDLWLELQYGWKPLLNDVYGAASALSDAEMERNRSLITVHASAQEKVYAPEYTKGQSMVDCDVILRRMTTTSHRCSVRLDYLMGNPSLVSVKELGLTNPFLVAWELVPFSFVADWFIPIGDFLSQLDADFGLIFKGGSISKKTDSRHTYSYKGAQQNAGGATILSDFCQFTGKGHQMKFHRTAFGASPLPSLPDYTKLVRPSSDHVANGIALLMSAITGGTRVR